MDFHFGGQIFATLLVVLSPLTLTSHYPLSLSPLTSQPRTAKDRPKTADNKSAQRFSFSWTSCCVEVTSRKNHSCHASFATSSPVSSVLIASAVSSVRKSSAPHAHQPQLDSFSLFLNIHWLFTNYSLLIQ